MLIRGGKSLAVSALGDEKALVGVLVAQTGDLEQRVEGAGLVALDGEGFFEGGVGVDQAIAEDALAAVLADADQF